MALIAVAASSSVSSAADAATTTTPGWRKADEMKRGKALVEAAEVGDYDRVSALLRDGAAPNATEYNRSLFYRSQNYVTPLHVAAANGKEAVLQLLIDAKADVNARDRFDVTALHMAAEKGHLQCLTLLLDAGADCNVATKCSKLGCYTATPHVGGTTPLHLASAANHVDCVKELIQNGADYNAIDVQGRTSLFVAAEAGFEKCVLVHLRNAIGRDILSLPVFTYGETPLHCCVRLRMRDCVDELLAHGSDANHRNQIAGSTPLHYAVFHSMESDAFEIMKNIVLNGYKTDVNILDNSGLSPLHYVSFNDGPFMGRRADAAAFLIAYGAKTDIVDLRRNCLLRSELLNGEDLTILRAIVKTLAVIPAIRSLNLPELAVASVNHTCVRYRDPWLTDDANASGDSCGACLAAFLSVSSAVSSASVSISRPLNQWNKIRWYCHLASTPRSLKHCCRVVIRRALCYKRLRSIWDLPISTNMKRYLLLEGDEFT